MNKSFFYSHLIEIESVITDLDKLELTPEQKAHLADLVDSSLHHTILDVVLSKLSPQDKKAFLYCLKEEDHSKIWQFLNEKVDKIEDVIKGAVDDLKEELRKDIKKAHQGHGLSEMKGSV